MKTLLIALALLLPVSCLAQQKTLVVEKIGTSKRYAYRSGDEINLLTRKDHLHLKNFLWILSDSVITVGTKTTLPVSDIGAVYHRMYFPKLMSNILLVAGGGYIILDAFNNLINNELVFEPATLIIGGSLMAAGVVLIPFYNRKCGIGMHWKVKVMDINIPVYF